MNFALVCVLAALVTVPFGAAFMLIPEVMSGLYGITGWNPGTLVVARLLGAELLAVGGLAFAVRGTTDRQVRTGFATWFSIASLIGAIAAGHGAATGAVNAMGWSTPAIYLFFAVAWASVARQPSR